MQKKTYKVVTLGCRTNQYESQAYIDQLKLSGYKEVKEGERAEICIVNTCTVTHTADQKSLYQIRKLKAQYRPMQLVVTGCLAHRLSQEKKTIPGVTHIVPNHTKETLLSIVYPEETWTPFQIAHFESHSRAFVKIQDGCNSYCSYCIIPIVRGRSRSKTISQIVDEVQTLVSNGYREIVLTGINIGDFNGGEEGPCHLSDLVQSIDQIDGLKRIRLSSIDPDEVDARLIDVIVRGNKTCPSLHISCQAGSNIVLKRMRRKYTRQDLYRVVRLLRDHNPDFTFTTDMIVGFPGETEGDFKETLEVIRDLRFAKVHMFPYSDRPRTRSSRMTDKISEEVIQERKKRLMITAKEVAFNLRRDFLGRFVHVLFENEDTKHPGFLMGHTEHFLPVYVPKKGIRPNDFKEVNCIDNTEQGLIARLVS